MQLLLVDYGSVHLGQLEAVCAKYELTAITSDKLPTVNVEGYDAVLISGSFGRAIADSPKDYEAALQLVTSADKPLLGIGFGFEVVCYGLGAKLDKIGVLGAGATVITPTDDGAKVFQGTDPMHVHEVERWSVEAEDLPKLLSVLASSESGVEAVRHKTKPIYGLQLFPEDFTYASDGKLVVENILASFKKLSTPRTPKAEPQPATAEV